MPSPSLLERLKQAHIVQVMLVYLGASWAVLQVVEVLQQGLGLPAWVFPVALLLAFVGLIVVLATAWIQALPRTSDLERRGEVPLDWQVDPADVLASLRAGRIPHLTWGRAILGGVVALSLLFGAAGAIVLFTDGRLPTGPDQPGDGQAAAGIAVVPFSVSGEDLDVWREGMVDLLSTGLDGLGGYRSIDSRTVLSRWRASVGDATEVDLREALSVAGSAGARFAVVGSAVSLGGRVRLAADVYDVALVSKVGHAQSEGSPDDVLTLADRLAVNVIRQLLGSRDGDLVSEAQVESLSTSSLGALRSYLSGESLMRRGEFERAASAYEEAIGEDSTFAMAYYRLTRTYGWMEAGGDRAARAELAVRALAGDLPSRDRLLLRGEEALEQGDADGVRLIEDATKRYPDDPDAWALLGELYAHVGARVYATNEDVRRAFAQAVELDPAFGPSYIHLTLATLSLGRPEEARTLLDTYTRLAPGTHQGRAMTLAFDLQWGDAAARAVALAALDTLGLHTAGDLTLGLAPTHTGLMALRAVADAKASEAEPGWMRFARGWSSVALGELDAARRFLPELPPSDRASLGSMLRLADPTNERTEVVASTCEGNAFCLFHVGVVAVDAGDRDVLGHVRTVLRADVADGQAGERDREAAVRKAGTDALGAYERWRKGDPDGAAAAMSEIQRSPESEGIASWLRLYMAEIAADAGRFEDADRILGSLETSELSWYAHVVGARAAAAAGRADEAHGRWAAFLELWQDAPEDLPLLAEARAGVSG